MKFTNKILKANFILILSLSFVLCYNAFSESILGFNITVKKLDNTINSKSDDYAPVLGPDNTLYFTSYRSDGSFGEADEYMCKFFSSQWQNSQNLGELMNTKGNDGSLALTPDGKTAVFASDGRGDGFGKTDLYIADFNNGQLSNIKNLGSKVNTKYWESQPTISADGKTIYFVSDRPGGYGGTDIWVTTLEGNGEWGEAQNLGNVVNTIGNERSPFIIPDGTAFFFSSDGHGGYGKKDIFMSTIANGKFTEPQNLGPPVNSEADDIFFFAPSKYNEFYFASARAGGSGLDIYSGSPNIFGNGMFRLCVNVLDSLTGSPMPSLVIISDSLTGQKLFSFPTTADRKDYFQPLPAGRIYKIEAQVRDYPVKTYVLTDSRAGTEVKAVLNFGALVIADFDLGKYDVPFFVTGYYRVNSPENLEKLIVLETDSLKEAPYVEHITKTTDNYAKYKAYSQTVEGIFKSVTKTLTEEVFPRFKTQALPNEILEMTFIGYADPTPVRAGARYVENIPVTFFDEAGNSHSVKAGDEMNNFVLSGLRADYADEYLDEVLMNSPGSQDYKELKNAGRIKVKAVAGGVSNDGSNFAAQRRIRIIITRTKK